MSFPEEFDPTRCILFLGAGFSVGAKNRFSEDPPLAKALERRLRKLVALEDDESSDLTDVAAYAIGMNYDVYTLLEKLYTIKEISADQRLLLDQDWFRIYTTNYDNCVSFHKASNAAMQHRDVFDFTDVTPRQLKRGSVIHLHGSIAKCDPKNLDASLILTRRSYVEQMVQKSLWWDWFDRDIRVAQYVFFVGYDLNDFEPAKYLVRYPSLKDRFHFILREPKNPIAERKISDRGVRHSFGLAGFVERLQYARTSSTFRSFTELRSFKYVDLAKDKKLVATPTSAEVQELLAFGRVRFDAMRATFPESSYVVIRSELVEKCLNELEERKTLVIHGRIGNGKSILADQLKIALTRNGSTCFELRENQTPLQSEIDFLRSQRSLVVFFPSYDSAVANAPLLAELPDSTRFVLEMQTGTLQVRWQEVRSKLIGEVGRVNVDKLQGQEVSDLRSLLNSAGLSKLMYVSSLKNHMEFRDFLLEAYEEPEIAVRLKRAIEPALASARSRRFVIPAAILKSSGVQIDVGFLRDISGEDPFDIADGLGELAVDLFDFSLDRVELLSAMMAEHILKRFAHPRDVADSIFDVAVEAARRVDDSTDYSSERFRRARTALSSVIRFGYLQGVIGKGADGMKTIGSLYESFRADSRVNSEPLYWLQYSIFWQEHLRWDLAESHMEEAYARGALRYGFKTFQLDTNYFGLLCDIEANLETGRAVQRFEKIIELLEKCSGMIDDGNHRDHVLKAFSKMEDFVHNRKGDLSREQQTVLVFQLRLVCKRLAGLSARDKALSGTEATRILLERAISQLTRT